MESQHDKLQALLRQPWKSICITGFTEEEAKLYIASEGFKHKFEQIKDISGTNPLLLSLLRKDDKIAEYRARILMEEEDFLHRNFNISRKRKDGIKAFLEHEKAEKLNKYIQYANKQLDVEQSSADMCRE